MVEKKSLIQVKNISELDKKRVVWETIKLFQKEGLSYGQAVELLEDTKDQIENIPINIFNQ